MKEITKQLLYIAEEAQENYSFYIKHFKAELTTFESPKEKGYKLAQYHISNLTFLKKEAEYAISKAKKQLEQLEEWDVAPELTRSVPNFILPPPRIITDGLTPKEQKIVKWITLPVGVFFAICILFMIFEQLKKTRNYLKP